MLGLFFHLGKQSREQEANRGFHRSQTWLVKKESDEVMGELECKISDEELEVAVVEDTVNTCDDEKIAKRRKADRKTFKNAKKIVFGGDNGVTCAANNAMKAK